MPEDSGSSPIAGKTWPRRFILQPQWNPYPTLPSFLLSLAYCSIMALSMVCSILTTRSVCDSSQAWESLMFGWYDPSHTHTHTLYTPDGAPDESQGTVCGATCLLLHHPTPSNEIQRNSAGEHWINRSPHKWQPATTIIIAGINTYSAIWHGTTTKTSHRSIHITAAGILQCRNCKAQ